jgi:hypothetical protein
MQFFLLHHRHEPHECAAAFAAWQGFDSPLTHDRLEATIARRLTIAEYRRETETQSR